MTTYEQRLFWFKARCRLTSERERAARWLPPVPLPEFGPELSHEERALRGQYLGRDASRRWLEENS